MAITKAQREMMAESRKRLEIQNATQVGRMEAYTEAAKLLEERLGGILLDDTQRERLTQLHGALTLRARYAQESARALKAQLGVGE